MKKILYSMLALLGIAGLVSCGGTEESSKKPAQSSQKQVEPTFWDADGNGIEDWQEEEITLTYASWQHCDNTVETIESMLVKEFMKKYPNITVEMKIVGQDYEWDDNMLMLMESNDLPDVFLVNRLATFLPTGMLADITDYWNNDPDTQYVFDSVKDLGLYNGKRYVVPTYLYPQFWVVNLDLLERYNVAIPEYDWTWDQMENIAKACTDNTLHNYGLYGVQQYFYEYCKVLDPETHPYSYGFTGEKFDFSSIAYLSAMNRMETALSEGWLINSLDEESLTEYYGDPTADPRYTGHVAIWREASWSVKNYLDSFEFEYDVYPAPSGVGMGNTDIAGVSASCKNKAAAYQLLKWMSYSEDGVASRYDIYANYGTELYGSGNNYPYPICDYGIDGHGVNKIWDNIPYGDTAAGLVSPEYTEALRNAAIQANKETIGWDEVNLAVNEYVNQILMGEAQFAALQSAIQSAADTAYKKAKEDMDAALS